MRNGVVWLGVAVGILFPGVATGAEGAPEPWWKVATGVLAIPAAVIGLAYSYVLIKKTRLEARKVELEIREKESKLQEFAAREPGAAQDLLAPIAEGRLTQLLVLRFVLLYLILSVWSILEGIVGLALTGLFVGIVSVVPGADESSLWVIGPFVVLKALPRIAYWLIFAAIGWPLFRDINGVLKINLTDFFFWWRKRPR